MLDHKYKWTSANHHVFIKYFNDNDFIILSMFVDDMLVI